jgi:hypothetical protein
MPGPQPSQASILSQSTTFNNDEIKALGDGGNNAVIVPAPGPNRIIHVIRGQAILDTSGGAYSGMVAGSGWALFTDANAGVYVSAIVPVLLPLSVTALTLLIFPSYVAGSPDMIGENDLAGALVSLPPSVSPANKPLVISDWFANGAYGDGNAANSLTVAVAYMIFNSATMEFE